MLRQLAYFKIHLCGQVPEKVDSMADSNTWTSAAVDDFTCDRHRKWTDRVLGAIEADTDKIGDVDS